MSAVADEDSVDDHLAGAGRPEDQGAASLEQLTGHPQHDLRARRRRAGVDAPETNAPDVDVQRAAGRAGLDQQTQLPGARHLRHLRDRTHRGGIEGDGAALDLYEATGDVARVARTLKAAAREAYTQAPEPKA